MTNFKKIFHYTLAVFVAISVFLMAFAVSFVILKNGGGEIVRAYAGVSNASELKSVTLGLSESLPKPFVVQSGSMSPAIETASLIFSVPSTNYQKGDVITFKRGNSIITHRIAVKTVDESGGSYFYTKGDANEEVDSGVITKESVIGKVVFSVPKVGYMVDFAKTPKGFILLVIVPATIIIYEEIKKLKKEILKALHNHFSFKGLPFKGEGRILSKLKFFVPALGVFLLIVGLSISFFHDSEESVGNIFGAASEFASPTPTPDSEPSPTPTPIDNIADTLVINEALPDTDCFVGGTEAQWIELYNGFPTDINPKNFRITDGTNTVDLVTANNLTIPSGGLLLLSHNSAIWGTGQNNCWDDNGVQTGNLGGQLNIDTEHLQLIDTDGTTVIDDVRWGSETTGLNITIDESIERDPKGFDTVTGSSFEPTDFTDRDPPQPGL